MTIHPARGILCMAALLFFFFLSGCGGLNLLPSQALPYDKLAIPYAATELGRSTTLDVLNLARESRYQFDDKQVEGVLLTQSDTVIAYSGRSADERKTWLNMLVFHEYRMTAGRKYFFCIDERARAFPRRKGILFDCRFVIDPEILTTPYATEEAQKIALVRWLAEQFERDLAGLVGHPLDPAQGSEIVLVSGMMVHQTFAGLLVELDESPGLAGHLGNKRGIPFPHLSLNEGRVRLRIDNNVAEITIRVNLPMPTSARW